jgi:hypothetical protein
LPSPPPSLSTSPPTAQRITTKPVHPKLFNQNLHPNTNHHNPQPHNSLCPSHELSQNSSAIMPKLEIMSSITHHHKPANSSPYPSPWLPSAIQLTAAIK